MVLREQVGLIFATIGCICGGLSDAVYSMIVIKVILPTLPPPILTYLLMRKPAGGGSSAGSRRVKVAPSPGWLLTVTSPPISWLKRRVR